MKINDKQIKILKFFLSRFLFFGLGISLILNTGEKDSLLAVILGYFLGIIIICIFNKLLTSINSKSIKKSEYLNIAIRLILCILYLFLISLGIIIFVCFIRDFFLPYTNTITTSLPFILLAVYLALKGMNAIAKSGEILFYILIVGFILTFFALLPASDMDNFLPILTINKCSFIKTSISFALLSTTPFLLMIDEKSNLKNDLKAYSLGTITIFLTLFIIISIFGSNLVKTFSYPEYVVLRQIKVFNFLENIENFIVLSWFFDIFITLSIAFNKLNKITKIKNKYINYLFSILLLIIINKLFIENYLRIDYIFKYIDIILFIFYTIIFSLLFIKNVIIKSNGK